MQLCMSMSREGGSLHLHFGTFCTSIWKELQRWEEVTPCFIASGRWPALIGCSSISVRLVAFGWACFFIVYLLLHQQPAYCLFTASLSIGQLRPISFVWLYMCPGAANRLCACATVYPGLLPCLSLLRGGFTFSVSSDRILPEDCWSCWERSCVSHFLCSSEMGVSERSRFLAVATSS